MNVEMDTARRTAGGFHDSSSSSVNPISGSTEMILVHRENHSSNNNNSSCGINGRTTATETPICTGNSDGSGNVHSKRRTSMKMHRRMLNRRNGGTGRTNNPGGKPGSSGRMGGRRQRRLWQLPDSSIDEYTKWIQEKPEADRTPNEQRFLWKCMIRSLGVVTTAGGTNSSELNAKRNRQERIREFVDRLETKEPMELTEQEELFVRLYHKRRKDRKAANKQRKQQQQQQAEDEMLSWMRGDGININSSSSSSNNNQSNSGSSNNSESGNGNNTNKHKNKNKGFEPQASLESLRESMNRMGLSSDKLKHVRFADQPTG